MLQSYFKIAIRNLTRNTIYSFINIAGLSFAIACSILIALWVIDEIYYDRFHKNYEQLYQVWLNADDGGSTGSWDDVPPPLYEELKARQNHFKNVAIGDTNEGATFLLTMGENRFNKHGRFVSQEFLEMFQFDILKVSQGKLLNDASSIVLTESTAKALFGEQDPVNKSLRVNNRWDVNVTGVLKDLPDNSSFQFDFLMPYSFYLQQSPAIRESNTDWESYGSAIYVELQPGVDIGSVNAEIKGIIKKYTTWLNKELFLYPMSRWHLHGQFEYGKEAETDRSDFVRGFSLIAIGIMLIACINFMNLSTARSERRAKEVGIRKIVGSQRKQLIHQFLGESIMISAIAFLGSLTLVELSLPFFNVLVQKKLFIDFTSPLFWLSGLALILATGLLSGSYPAFYLSSFNPVKILKGKMHIGTSGMTPRKVLVIIQFGFSILLITATIVIYQQIQYGRNRELGYRQENLITIPDNDELANLYKITKKELIRTGAVASVTKSNSPITEIYEANYLDWPGNSGPKVSINNIFAEYDYLNTMGISLVEGRDFSEESKSDTATVILNKAAIDIMGLNEPIGSKVVIGGQMLEIIGITEDVLMEPSFVRSVWPLYIVLETKWAIQTHPRNITIRLADNREAKDNIKMVEAVFRKFNPSYPFQYAFVSGEFNKRFDTISRIGTLTNLFAFLAIFIACLGLFGLTAFTVERRTKEFGIRKVLGASAINLVDIMSRDFTKTILIAFLVSSPLTWWALNSFLERYPYRIEIPWWTLPGAGAAVLLVSLVIIGTQALKVAITNPVDSLKVE